MFTYYYYYLSSVYFYLTRFVTNLFNDGDGCLGKQTNLDYFVEERIHKSSIGILLSHRHHCRNRC